MTHLHMTHRNALRFASRLPRSGQRGLTLIEFMVSVVIGMLMVAVLAILIADQSGNRAEVDRSGRMIENGRYAVRTIAEDLQMAGYWGELATTGSAPAALPNPCSLVVADIEAAMPVHVQGYDAPAGGAVPTCITNLLAGTDILVSRHVDPDSSSLETVTGVPDMTKVAATPGSILLQTGMNSVSQAFSTSIGTSTASASTNATAFPLLAKDMATAATVRKVLVRIFYISECSVPVGPSCTNGDGGTPIPTLKMQELSVAGGAPAWSTVTLAEGIENLQVDYGVDTNGDGAPEGADTSAAGIAAADWANVVTAKLYLLARSSQRTPGYVDDKTYFLGTAGTTAATNDGFKRHVFVQSVRLVNPNLRRQS